MPADSNEQRPTGLVVPDFVAVDVETTGLDPAGDAIIQVGAVRVTAGEPTGRFESLVNPKRSVSLRIQRMTGATKADLDSAPSEDAVMERLVEFVGDAPVAGHNLSFDLSFLRPALARCGFARAWDPCYDSLEMARLLLPAAPNHRLGTLASVIGLAQGELHRAGADAMTSALMFVALQRLLWGSDFQLLGTMARLLSQVPSGAARVVGQAYHQRSRFFAGVAPGQGGATPSAPSSEIGPLTAVRDDRAVTLDDMDGVLGPGGNLARLMPHYEYRPCQEEMLNLVRQAFSDGGRLFVEAGTGTGKSLAYLLPAVYWSLSTGEKVVISTHTINLQEQLISKDVPLVRQVTGLPFVAAVLKGRTNYLCLRKWDELLEQDPAEIPPGEAMFLAQVARWLGTGGSGDRGDLSLTPDQEELWATLNSEGSSCVGEECPRAKACYLNAARRRAAAADLVIVNHSLLLSDLSVSGRVLPPYRYLVCDEGHNLEDVATEHLGIAVSRYGTRRWLGTLFKGYRGGFPGLLGTLRQRLATTAQMTADAGQGVRERLVSLVGEAIAEVDECRQACDRLFDSVSQTALSGQREGASELPSVEWRLRPDNVPAAVLEGGRTACVKLRLLAATLARLAETLRNQSSSTGGKSLAGWAERVSPLARIAGDAAAGVERVLAVEGEEYVHWVACAARQGSDVSLRAAPVDVGPLLRAGLFDRCRSVVVTSATLAAGADFGYATRRLGFADGDDHQVAALASPFRYDEQALVCVVKDAPDPRQAGPQLVAHLAHFLADLAGRTKGRTLVLFTSYRMLAEVYQAVKPRLEAIDICPLAQGFDGSRTRLIEEFRGQDRTVLMGTASFWEGVDIPGAALSCVVIVRLPFWPPGRPVIEARSEAVTAAGGDSFSDYAVPQAIIRFKQGFGRLIRGAGDRGAVVVYDPRAALTGYGRRFLAALPGPRLHRGPAAEVAAAVEAWIGGEW